MRSLPGATRLAIWPMPHLRAFGLRLTETDESVHPLPMSHLLNEQVSQRRSLTVLTLVATYLPGFKSGGPIRSISSLVEALGREVTFRIITGDRDSGDREPYANVASDTWRPVGNAKVYYATRRALSIRNLRRLLSSESYDVLYLNSFFSFDFTIKPLVLRRLGLIGRAGVVLAPRGQFSAGALAIKSAKKRSFIAIARLMGLYENLIWQATSAHEVEDIRRLVGAGAQIVLAEVPRALVGARDRGTARSPKQRGVLRVAFLGRIARMKNLDFALRRLLETGGTVAFDIFGPMEDRQYWRQCESIIDAMPSGITVRYRGAVPYEEVINTLEKYDLFFLPTKGENFGHAIVDALLAGCPVLISDRTPWRNLKAHGCGCDIPLHAEDEYRAALRHFIEMEEEEIAGFRERAVGFGRDQMLREDALHQNRHLFMSSAAS